jgi:hypothetical protein
MMIKLLKNIVKVMNSKLLYQILFWFDAFHVNMKDLIKDLNVNKWKSLNLLKIFINTNLIKSDWIELVCEIDFHILFWYVSIHLMTISINHWNKKQKQETRSDVRYYVLYKRIYMLYLRFYFLKMNAKYVLKYLQIHMILKVIWLNF